MAREAGHAMVKGGGTLERGNWGYDCVEPDAPLIAAIRMAKERLRNAAASTAHEMALLARAGNKQARGIFDSARQFLAIAVTGFIDTLNLPLHRLGVGVCGPWALLSRPIFRHIKFRSNVYRLKKPEVQEPAYPGVRETYILKAKLGPEAGLRGACVPAWESFTPWPL
jgi:predicted NBD/HSP70 family sugar kinase